MEAPNQALNSVDYHLVSVLFRIDDYTVPPNQVEIHCGCGNRERFVGLQVGQKGVVLKGLFIQDLASGEFTLVRGTVTRHQTKYDSVTTGNIVLRCTNPFCLENLDKHLANRMNYTVISRDRITGYQYLYLGNS